MPKLCLRSCIVWLGHLGRSLDEPRRTWELQQLKPDWRWQDGPCALVTNHPGQILSFICPHLPSCTSSLLGKPSRAYHRQDSLQVFPTFCKFPTSSVLIHSFIIHSFIHLCGYEPGSRLGTGKRHSREQADAGLPPGAQNSSRTDI